MEIQEQPAMSSDQARTGDGMLVIVQNNAERSLTITATNDMLEQLLGYQRGELLNRNLMDILGKDLRETITEDLEYEDAAPDLGEILQRIRQIRLRNQQGEDVSVEIATSRLLAQDRNARFQMVVVNERNRLENTRLKDFIAMNLEGRKEIDAATGLPNRKTAREFLPLLKNYLADNGSGVVFAVLRIDRFDKSVARYGQAACAELLKQTHQMCISTFRSKDLFFSLGEDTLGLVLFDLSRESARVVLNRFRWKVKSQRFSFGGKPDFSISISIGFDVLDLEHTEDVFDRCEKAMVDLEAAERNALIELEAA